MIISRPYRKLKRPVSLSENGTDMDQQTDPIMQFFAFEHLPERLQAVSRPFGQLAAQIIENLPRNPERTVALRKLLEAKDAAVRAELFR
jgi:hypothetical protein